MRNKESTLNFKNFKYPQKKTSSSIFKLLQWQHWGIRMDTHVASVM